MSGTPIEAPPKLDTNGNPIFVKGHDDDDDDAAKSDKAADGMGIIDAVQKKFLRKIPVGSDPEQFALSKDGKRIYISNEDVGAATVLDADTGNNLTFIPVTREPEGAAVRPDGKFFTSPARPAATFSPLTRKLSRSWGHRGSSAPAQHRVLCRTVRARLCRPNR